MEFLIALVLGLFLGATFYDPLRTFFRLCTGGYLFRSETDPKPKDDAKP